MQDSSKDSRLIVPALGGLYDRLARLAYPLLRFCFGALFIPHGWAKIVAGGVAKYDAAGALVGGTAAGMASMNFPMPEVLAWYIGLLELVGGAMLAIGLLTRLMAIQFAGFMFVAAFVVHSSAWFWTAKGMEFPLMLMVIGLVIFIRGGGNLSVDKSLPREF
jgi:putative oxidoreductase